MIRPRRERGRKFWVFFGQIQALLNIISEKEKKRWTDGVEEIKDKPMSLT
jgi:hypothetical protein